jgi:hypothetical protein
MTSVDTSARTSPNSATSARTCTTGPPTSPACPPCRPGHHGPLEGPSGYQLELSLGPLDSLMSGMRLARDHADRLLPKFTQRLFQAGQHPDWIGLPVLPAKLTARPYTPTDKAAVLRSHRLRSQADLPGDRDPPPAGHRLAHRGRRRRDQADRRPLLRGTPATSPTPSATPTRSPTSSAARPPTPEAPAARHPPSAGAAPAHQPTQPPATGATGAGERGEHDVRSVLDLDLGAGPGTSRVWEDSRTCVAPRSTTARPARTAWAHPYTGVPGIAVFYNDGGQGGAPAPVPTPADLAARAHAPGARPPPPRLPPGRNRSSTRTPALPMTQTASRKS